MAKSSVLHTLADDADYADTPSLAGWSSQRMQTVRSACKLPPDARSEETVDEIVEFVKAGAKDAKFFSKVSPLLRRALCRMMQIQAFQPGSFAVDKDDLPDKYCIVFTGSVDLLQAPQQAEGRCPSGLHKEGSCECQKVFQKVLGVQAGGSFGETVMQDELPKQNFAACCVEATELLVTKRSDFDLCSAQLHRQFIEQRVRFLRGFPRIEEALQYSLVTTQDIDYIYIYIYVYIYIYMNICFSLSLYENEHEHEHIYIYIYIYVSLSLSIYIYIYIYTYT